MTDSPNLDLVRSIYAAWGRGDWSRTDWADSEIEFVIADGPQPEAVRGVTAMARSWREFLGALEQYAIHVEDCREIGDERVLVTVRVAGRGKTSGVDLARISPRAANVLHFRDGKVTRFVLYWDREHAFADLGLDRGPVR